MRARSVLVAVVVLVIAMLVGGTGLVFALRASLEQSVEATGRARAAEVVARITTNGVQETVTTLGDQSRTDAVTLVLDSRGNVIGSSRRTATVPLSAQRPRIGAYTSVEQDIDTLDEGGEWKVVTTAPTSAEQTYYVQVAVPIRIQRDTMQTVVVLLLAATPLLLAAVSVAVWVLVGRALRSVEQIRTTVAEIDARALTARLQVPPTRDEIAPLAQTMNAMLDRLQACDRAQRAFVSDASHELRGPLATLSTAAELAGRTSDEDVWMRLLDTMNAELVRMRGLVGNLMTLARVDGHDAGANTVDVDLDDLVDQEARRLRTTTRFDVSSHIEPVRVLADLARVAQPLRNLVDNAEGHAAERIGLRVTTQGDQAVIWVDNDGPRSTRRTDRQQRGSRGDDGWMDRDSCRDGRELRDRPRRHCGPAAPGRRFPDHRLRGLPTRPGGRPCRLARDRRSRRCSGSGRCSGVAFPLEKRLGAARNTAHDVPGAGAELQPADG